MKSRRVVLPLVALAVLVGVIGVLLPPRAASSLPRNWNYRWPIVTGAFHVHSQVSDGTGTIAEIAQAAVEAGLQFVVMTDHGNGTRPLQSPQYYAGVLMIDGVEISTDQGHYAAVGFTQSPYPLAGHARAVIEDVRRLGGFGFAAHPGSPKPALRWDDWAAPFDGLEWLNADSEWRDELWGPLARSVVTYPFRPAESLAAVLDRPSSVMAQWDRLTRQRRVPAIAGADAHARLGFKQNTEPYVDREIARIPSYRTSFEAFKNRVILDQALTGDPAFDTILVLGAMREGRTFTTIDGLAQFEGFEASATSGTRVARVGEHLDLNGRAIIEARVAGPEGTLLQILRDGDVVHQATEAAIRFEVGDQPGAYRIEAHLPSGGSASVPWIVANPFYIGMRATHEAHAHSEAPATAAAADRLPIATQAWEAEASPGSTSVLTRGVLADGTLAIVWTFALAAGAPGNQFAALRFPIDGKLVANARLHLRAEADKHLRLWAQLRAAGDGQAQRWGRSFYLDPTGLRTVDLAFDQFAVLGPTKSPSPSMDTADALLLVIDALNTPPGTTGRLSIADLWIVK